MKQFALVTIIGVVLAGCAAGPDDTGLEYAPNMYHSVPYEPLSQVTDKGSGEWVYALDFLLSQNKKESPYRDDHGEYYNSNPYNPNRMTMRAPVPGTVRRGQYLPVRIAPDDYEAAARLYENPTDSTEAVIKDGKLLYESFCQHCHGAEGNGDGAVSSKYLGIANLNGAAYKILNEGHIYHVITYGKGLMGAHGSQISEEDRWKIARYVKVLQQK